MKTNKPWITLLVFSVLLFAIGSGAALAFAQPQNTATAANQVPAAVISNVQPASLAANPASSSSAISVTSLDALQSIFENVYAQVNPSVVSIQVVEQASSTSFSGFGFNSPQTQGVQQALGSGFVWDTAGHIVTNNHVIAGASSITVTFADGYVATAKLVGADPNSDLAVIQVNVPAAELHPVQLADSTKVHVGDVVIAIGNPFGLQNTMTQGIISGLSRSLPVGLDNPNGQTGYSIPDIIQTDASINPGNSGGVLLDIQGNLVGVTAAIASQSGSSSGVGFVIPSSIVNRVVPSLIKTGTYNHPWLGFSGVNITPDVAQAMNLSPTQQGALVVDVTPNGPADKAGLAGSQSVRRNRQSVTTGGDIITAINGQPVTSYDQLSAYVFDNTQVGQTVTLTVLRNGREFQAKVTLGIQPAQ